MNIHRILQISKAQRVHGRTLVFRNAVVKDADFILSLRSDKEKSKYLSQTPAELSHQIAWLIDYAGKSDQAYFIIETKEREPLGTVRLYDARSNSICWGSWILKDGAPQSAAIESALMVYSYAANFLGFRQAHFDVRKGNENVWRFHERMGAERVGETASDYLYRIDIDGVLSTHPKYRKYLPKVVTVEW